MNNTSMSSSAIYWRLISYLKDVRGAAALCVLGIAIFASSLPILADFAGEVMLFINNKDPRGQIYLPVFICGVFAMRAVGTMMDTYFNAVVAQSVVHRLRTQMFDRLLLTPASTLANKPKGDLIASITYNTEQVIAAVTDAVRILIREGFTVIGLFGYIIYLNWKLTIVFFVIIPVLAVIVKWASKKLRTFAERIQSGFGEVAQVSDEFAKGWPVIRIFGGNRYESDRFAIASEHIRLNQLRLAKVQSIATPVSQFTVAAAVSLIIYLIFSPFIMDTTSSENLISYITAAALLPKAIKQLADVNAKIQRGVAASATIFDTIDAPIEQDHGTQTVERFNGGIELRNLSFAYDQSTPVLRNLDLTIKPGETVALVGRSGSGKSTLVNLLPRFFEATDGDILIDGTPISQLPLATLRRQISFVSQQVTLFHDTIKHNIAYGELANKTDEQIRAAAEMAYATEFIDALDDGFDTMMGDDGSGLSGGQKQRIAIARAMLKDAPILILDEATSALDNQSEVYIQKALEGIMGSRTTLVIAHRLSTVENADRILVMEQGQIIEQGTHTELLAKNGLYATLHSQGFEDS